MLSITGFQSKEASKVMRNTSEHCESTRARQSLARFLIVSLLTLVMLFSSGPFAWATETPGASVHSSVGSTTTAESPEDAMTKNKLTKNEPKKDALAGYMAGESVFPGFMKITLALMAVIAGIYLTLTLLKKAMGRKVSSGGRGSAIQVIETCYLAPKRSISLVRIGSRGALLSVSDNSIATLLELNPEETREIVEMVNTGADAPDFRQTLSKARQKIIDLGSYAMRHRERSQAEQTKFEQSQVERVGVK
jgi:flagellar biogenesis protein FliO